jgi:hypothetical protein
MLQVTNRQRETDGEMWLTEPRRDEWVWIFSALPYLVHEDLRFEALKFPPDGYLQRDSDLDLKTLPLYVCKVPSVAFFPYVTYFVGTWFQTTPTFVIPRVPLDRLGGRFWLDGIVSWPFDLIRPEHRGLRLRWVKPDGTPCSKGIEYMELVQRAYAARTYLLDEIRYVYDESKSSLDSRKTNAPSRHQFSEEVAAFAATEEYLNWYIDSLNGFFSKLIAIGKHNDKEGREQCLIAKSMLEQTFLRNSLVPTLEKIPVKTIRDQVIDHTINIYDAIDRMSTKNATGQDLLWEYRNSRHGYAIKKRDALLLHSGRIPDDLPDLTIALWHYVLLGFPFRS